MVKVKIMLNPNQAENFFQVDDKDRIGTVITSKTELSNGTLYKFKGVVESYTVSYGEVYLICEGVEVFD